MKRCISFLVAAAMLFCLLPGSAQAATLVDSGTYDNGQTWTLDSDGLLTISGTGEMMDVVDNSGEIPWAEYTSRVTKAIITDGITSVGDAAFWYCENLTSVTIPDSVSSIGDHAFEGCIRLPSITIPDSVTSIGSIAFYDCESLTSITIPDSVVTIGEMAFDGCDSLTSITIPDSITDIRRWAFDDCTALIFVTFEGTTPPAIGESAFEGVSATVYYPESELWTEDVRQDYGGTLTWKLLEAAVCGDADGDGEITDWDGILLNRYLAGWSVKLSSLDGLDIDGDGEITDWDGVLLDRYLAGWSIDTGIGK